PAVAVTPPATSAPAGPEPRICRRFRAILPAVIRAVAHHRQAALFRYDGRLGHWSYTATFTAHDAQFANYLSDAGTELGVVASPIGKLFERKAATDLGKVNGYCKYDV